MERARIRLSRPVARFSSVRSCLLYLALFRSFSHAIRSFSSSLYLGGGLRYWFVGGLPGVEAAGEIGDFTEACAAQDAGGDGAAITALAVDDEELAGVEFAGSVGQLAQRDPDGVFEGSG